MKRILLIAACISLVSCSGIKPTAIKSQPYTKEFVLYDQPYSKEIGTPLIEKTTGYEFTAITIIKGSRISQSKMKIDVGNIYELKGTSDGYDLYYTVASGMIKGLAFPKDGGKPKYFYAMTLNSYSMADLVDDIEFTKESRPDGSKDYFKQEFIFSGKTGNQIKFTYREYVNGLARPSFSQDLQYDLAESKIIGFKGLRLEVINANNVAIDYKIIKSFD